MNEFVIITDSSCDLPASVAENMGVKVIPLEVNMEGVIKLNDEIDIKEFYAYLREKHGAKTSAVNMERFIETFETYVAEGKDLLYIGFSSGLSATYMAAKNAAEELSEQQVSHPHKKHKEYLYGICIAQRTAIIGNYNDCTQGTQLQCVPQPV
jgi:DegV family protein with EDD domain